ncbi:MAG: hypothetical protein V1806_03840 [Pseudomonadota bacterium]
MARADRENRIAATAYLAPELKARLVRLSGRMTAEAGKRVSEAQVITMAIERFLEEEEGK